MCEADGSMQSQWQCATWASPSAGCPTQSPRLGSGCSPDGVSCEYQSICSISLGPNVICENGYWEIDNSHVVAGSCAILLCGH
jgi:hypothetical protein